MKTKKVKLSVHSNIIPKRSNTTFVPQTNSKVHGYLGHPGPPFPSDQPARLSCGLCPLPFVFKELGGS